MNQVLSQEEIDALLKGISGGKINTDGEECQEENITTYDLTNLEKIEKSKMPTLEIINHRFCNLIKRDFSSMFRKVVYVRSLSVVISKFGNFIKSLTVPTSIHLFKMEPLKGFSLLTIESRVFFSLIDIFLGGDGLSVLERGERDFTKIEERIIKKIVFAILKEYTNAWKPVHNITFEYSRSEINPKFAKIVPYSDMVIIKTFEIKVEQISGNITICIPYKNIEPIKAKLSAGFYTESCEIYLNWVKKLKRIIKSLQVDGVVKYGETELTIGKILSLKKGDIINLNKNVGDLLQMEIEGVPKFNCYADIVKSCNTVKVVGKIRKEEM
jgi:flagellar motor switch protein FliM